METSPLPVKAANFDLVSALMAIDHWGFFSVPHVPFIMVIFEDPWYTPFTERLAVELSQPVFYNLSQAAGIRTPNLALAGRTF